MFPRIESKQPSAASPNQTSKRSVLVPVAATGALAPVPTGASYVVRELLRRGIEVVCGIPGGAILPLYDAIAQSSLRHVLARNEQGAGFVAQGMARCTGRAAVCLATSGPGATNLVTALADAQADSVPLVAITAQVPRALIGTNAFQEVDTCGLVRGVTKGCWLVSHAEQLPARLAQAFEMAEEGRKGPVLLDIPKDVLSTPWEQQWEKSLPVEQSPAPSPATTVTLTPATSPQGVSVRRVSVRSAEDPQTWRDLAALLANSQRPLLYIGGGVRWAGAESALAQLVAQAKIPVVCSLHGLGSLPAEEPLNLGMLGMHGAPYANRATEAADFVLAVGVRFDDRATGEPKSFCRNARIVHVDVDARELGKIKPIHFGVVADAKCALQALLSHLRPMNTEAWRQQVAKSRTEFDSPPQGKAGSLLCRVDCALPRNAVVTTDVGQHQMWAAQYLGFSPQRKLLTSGGLGTMGFGLPAAIGAALACPEQAILCVSGDGSLLMNLSELATLREQNLNVTVLLFNNAELGMVRQQQDMFYGKRQVACCFESQPDFVQIAAGFGIRAERMLPTQMSEHWLRVALSRRGPQLIEVSLKGQEDVLPIVPAGASNLDMRMS